MSEYVIVSFLIIGSIFILLAAVGVARMPDIFSRMHATSKAAMSKPTTAAPATPTLGNKSAPL